ncbi:helix-turn-helix domain-containing protein [Pacificispira sp.]|uniref:helix-turn-helix domain-containing protein n=1 Tax=Pacificispira sp. TaxID=2888761 RepID=UPI003BACC4AE
MNPEEFALLVARNVRACRVRSGLSQSELADRAGLESDCLAQVEAGSVPVSSHVLFELAHALECPVQGFVQENQSEPKYAGGSPP